MKIPYFHSRFAGFTLKRRPVIMSIVLAVLSVVAAGIHAKDDELDYDPSLEFQVRVLNRAVAAYLRVGGELESASDAGLVVAKLQTASEFEDLSHKPGYFVDPRLVPMIQSPPEAASVQRRALWNPRSQRFFVSPNGPQGIKAFVFDYTL